MSHKLTHPVLRIALSTVFGGAVFTTLTWAWEGSLEYAILAAIPWTLFMMASMTYWLYYRPRAAAIAEGKGRAWTSVDHGVQLAVPGESAEVRAVVMACLRERGELEVLESEDGLLVAALTQSGSRDVVTAVFKPRGDGADVRLTSRPAVPKTLFEGPRNHATVHAIADRLVERFGVEARQRPGSRTATARQWVAEAAHSVDT